ncbi:hypothetical protein H0B56_12155 [Haloechinothrix sp. YIM 98757]|uniref:AAA domain-containing protein n=1 Tax=Haloechinothrix aidingensis TaxID=2752311 RepID=A0A838AAQ0_9PSEU|nr:hypothetical protein [Haloechinothrix aidingensis]MBA0126295.1 hypothetical protein [Haloechinothrix aidingensis]
MTTTDYCEDHGQTEVHVVFGPPCSGKSTFVDERRRPGDLVVDWDRLMMALAGQASRHHDPVLAPYVAAARDAVISRLGQRRGGREPRSAWIVATWPLNHGMVWTDHVMDTSMDECLRRLYADPDGRDVAEVESVIRSWFTRHQSLAVHGG